MEEEGGETGETKATGNAARQAAFSQWDDSYGVVVFSKSLLNID